MDNCDAQIRPDGDAEREPARLLVSTSGTVPRPWPRCGVEDSAQRRSAGRLRIGGGQMVFDRLIEIPGERLERDIDPGGQVTGAGPAPPRGRACTADAGRVRARAADAPRQRRVSAAEVEHAPRGERLGQDVDPASSADDPSAARGGAIREGEQADVRWLDR